MRIVDIFRNIIPFFESTDPKYRIVLAKAFNKNKIKYSNKKSNIKLLDTLVDTLEDSGEITTNNAHRIGQPIYSEYTKSDESGWVAAWISRTDDLRVVYKRFDSGIIEVKFGKARDVGYEH